MQKKWLWLALVPVLFILAWWVGYSSYGQTDKQIRLEPATNTAVSVKPKEAPRKRPVTPPAEVPGPVVITVPDPILNEPSDEPVDPLEYITWEIDERSRDAKVCFAFRQPMDQSDNLKIRDYISITPSFKFAQTVSGNDLCISGFDWVKDYSVTIKEGLPGIENRKLLNDITETVTFGDKPQFVGFVGQGIILPRVGAQGLAIETMNVETLMVEVARVSDRMIARRTPQVGQTVQEGRYGYAGRDAATQVRVKIWDGEVDVETTKNTNVTTVLPLKDMIGELEPGAYIVSAKRKHDEDEHNYAQAWRWVIVTDLAITSYRGKNGMNVTVRSIDSAQLQPGIDVLLVAQNNEILAKDTSDGSGHVFFAPALMEGTGPQAPKMVLAYGREQDFALLDLDRSAVSMGDQDISGRYVDGDTDIYSFTERGVYRPGETVHFTVMMRDREALAQSDRPVTLSVHRPNGLIIETHRVDIAAIEKTNGVINWAYDVPRSAQRGNWRLSIKADGTKRSHNVGFAVEDFVPQKLRVTIKAEETPIKIGEIRDFKVDAQFLYGAPGTALVTEAEARLRLDVQPFKDYTSYSFGPHKKNFREKFVEMGTSMTDGAGLAEFGFDYKNSPYRSVYPMRAEIIAGVAEPGGRYIRESKNIPVRSEDVYVGIAQGYSSQSIPSGEPAKYKVIAVDPDGKALSQKLNWKLWQENWSYQWYRQNGRWRYRYDRRDLPISEGSLRTLEAGPAIWNHKVGSGRFRLELSDGDTVLASRQFWSGWGRSFGNSEAPDSLEVNTVNESVSRGDTVNLTVRAPYAGEGELVIASDKVHLVKSLSLSEGSSDVSFKFDPAWGDSVYALMTLYTPRDASERPVPRRAIGVSYIALDRSDQILELTLETPEVIRPRQKHVFNVKVGGDESRKNVLLNFAAVDEGILQITKFKSPDASKHFLAKKALGISFLDDYGRILNANMGTPSKVRSGGDSLGGEGLTVVPTKTVALFQGFVPVKNGTARVELDIPDFNGELRLMATAWNDRAFGSVSAPIKVRDKVPAIVAMPRFLAPGDKAKITVSLDNVEGNVGDYQAKLTAGGVLKADESLTFALAKGERQQKRIDISAGLTGVEDVNLKIDGPGGYKVNSMFPIQVRSAFYPLTETKYVSIEPGESFTLTSDWTAKYVPEATDVSVSFTKLPGIDPAPIVSSLRKYPYGCTEQTVSTALPLIYASELGGIPGQTDLSRKRAIQDAIYRLSNRVSKDGSFGLWRSGDRYAHSWVGVYATDFMFRAKAEGYYVPEDILELVTKASVQMSTMPRNSSLRYYVERRGSTWDISRRAESAAYAHYVLALNGEGDLGKIRYHYDNHRNKMGTPLSWAYLGGALTLMGDDRRAEEAFETSIKKLDFEDQKNYYYSMIRDRAGIVAVASEVGANEVAFSQLEELSRNIQDRKWLNTQEKGYLILAFRSLMKNADPAIVSAKNTGLTKSGKNPVSNMFASDLAQNPEFTNNGDTLIWASVSVEGPPVKAPEAVSNHLYVNKTLYTKDGKQIEGSVKQGQQVVVKIEHRSIDSLSRSIVIADLLPAGFEIETVLKPSDGQRSNGKDKGPYSWLGKITGHQIAEKRDDRFVASLTTYHKKTLVSAYVMRAVTPGEYTLPGAVIEDMYRAEDHGISKSGRISITSDPEL